MNARHLASLFLVQQKVQNSALSAGSLLCSANLLHLASQAAHLANTKTGKAGKGMKTGKERRLCSSRKGVKRTKVQGKNSTWATTEKL